MALWWTVPLVVIVGYLLGNFQTGVVVSKQLGRFDVRKHGSKSPGTTNVLRTMGWLPSLLTLTGDVLKGLIAGLIGLWLIGPHGARLGGLAAVIGHNWPALYRFKGGKGIATSLGAILPLDPWIGLCLLAIQALVVAITKTMSVASITSAIAYSVLTCILHWGDWPQIAFALAITVLALWTHRANMQRLKQNAENRLDFHAINSLSRKNKREE